MNNSLKTNLSTAPCTQSGVVAIVDDDRQICEALAVWYELSGFLVVMHASAESLLASIVQKGDRLYVAQADEPTHLCELVAGVFDLNLPGLSGQELAERLRSMVPALPLAIITSLPLEEGICSNQGTMDLPWLLKPFELDALDRALFSTCPRNSDIHSFGHHGQHTRPKRN